MRMINADDLEQALKEAGFAEVIKDDCSKCTSAWGVPIVDAEPVIRCKDCFFCGEIDENGWHWCQCTGAGMPKDGFCSDAERKGWNWGR